MGKPTGFLELTRQSAGYRPVAERLADHREVFRRLPVVASRDQGARCMDCGIPFCHQGCPLGNLIPDWNDLAYRDQWRSAIDRLHLTNNFPEFTGTLCPAPCEASCVLAINDSPVTIKQIELEIVDRAWDEGWITPEPPIIRTGKKVAIIGSGPAGLAAAQQLARAGHEVTVFERSDKIGGLLRYGIPDFKMEKYRIDRRIGQMKAEGVFFRTSVDVGEDLTAEELLDRFDAVALCAGAGQPWDLKIPGRELSGIHFAMDWLPLQNRLNAGLSLRTETFDHAHGKDVVIVGGGDTGADCLGTVHRHGARSVRQFEIVPRPPDQRSTQNPWPQWWNTFRVASAHEEGGSREYSINTTRFVGEDGRVKGLETVRVESRPGPDGRPRFEPVAGSEAFLPADLVLLAIGFAGPERGRLVSELEVQLDERGNVLADQETKATSVPKVFAAGDMARGQSLIVWAIAEGRQAAAGIDAFLMGRTDLPQPLEHGNHLRPFVA